VRQINSSTTTGQDNSIIDGSIPPDWVFGTKEDFGITTLKGAEKLRRVMTRFLMSPFRSGVKEVLSHFDVNPENFSGLPLSLDRGKEGYFFSVLSSIHKAITHAYGAGTKDKHSLTKLSKLIKDSLLKDESGYWYKNFKDVEIDIPENKSQWEDNRDEALAYVTKNLEGKATLTIAPHLLNPVIGEKARKFLVTFVIAFYMAEHWAKTQREIFKKNPKDANKRYKAFRRKIKIFGIKEDTKIDRSIANLMIFRELIRGGYGVNPFISRLLDEPFKAIRKLPKDESFIASAENALKDLSLSPSFSAEDIEKTYKKALESDKKNKATPRTKPEEVALESTLELIKDKLIHKCDSSNSKFSLSDSRSIYCKITAISNWLAHKKQPQHVVIAGALLELSRKFEKEFDQIIKSYKSSDNETLKKAALLADNQFHWKELLARAPNVPTKLDDNWFEQNELDRVISGWTFAAQEFIRDNNDPKYSDWEQVREEIAILSASRVIFDLNRDYTDLTKEELINASLVARFSLSRALKFIGLKSVASKIEHEVLVHKNEQYYATNQAIRKNLGLDHNQSEAVATQYAKTITSKLEAAGLIDFEVNVREKEIFSEFGKVIDSYIENLKKCLEGKTSLFSDTPTVEEINRTHIDNLGIIIELKSEESLKKAIAILKDDIFSFKEQDYEQFKKNSKINPEYLAAKLKEAPHTRNGETGEIEFIRTAVIVKPWEVIKDQDYSLNKPILVDVHFATSEYTEGAKEGTADVKYRKAHLDMKFQREVENFAFLTFLHERGIQFTEEGIPVSIEKVLPLYTEFLKIKENYKPVRLYGEAKDFTLSQINWDGEKYVITPPKEVIISYVNKSGRLVSHRTLSGVTLKELSDQFGSNLASSPDNFILNNYSVDWPGYISNVSGRNLDRIEVTGFKSPFSVSQLLRRRGLKLDAQRATGSVISFLNSKEGEYTQAIQTDWYEKIFRPVAEMFDIKINDLLLIISKGYVELQHKKDIKLVIDHVVHRVSTRKKQSFITASISKLDISNNALELFIDFDERSTGTLDKVVQTIMELSDKYHLGLSIEELKLLYPSNQLENNQFAERQYLKLTPFDKDRTMTEEEYSKFCTELSNIISTTLFSRSNVPPGTRINRELKVTIPKEYKSFSKLVKAVSSLELAVIETKSFNPDTGEVTLLLGCEDIQEYFVTEEYEIFYLLDRSDEIRQLTDKNTELEVNICKEIGKQYSSEQSYVIIQSLWLEDPLDKYRNRQSILNLGENILD
jgi:hypothetical protein